MTKEEFIKYWIGKPWEDRAIGPYSVDCWGLIYLYYRDVLGIELSKPSDHQNIETGFDSVVSTKSDWVETDNTELGLMFMAFEGDAPRHCGLVISKTDVIHSFGGQGINGRVSINKIAALKHLYGKVKFYEYNHGTNTIS